MSEIRKIPDTKGTIKVISRKTPIIAMARKEKLTKHTKPKSAVTKLLWKSYTCFQRYQYNNLERQTRVSSK